MFARIPFVACVSLVWTCILSIMRGGDIEHAQDLIGGAVTGASLHIVEEGFAEASFLCTETIQLDSQKNPTYSLRHPGGINRDGSHNYPDTWPMPVDPSPNPKWFDSETNSSYSCTLPSTRNNKKYSPIPSASHSNSSRSKSSVKTYPKEKREPTKLLFREYVFIAVEPTRMYHGMSFILALYDTHTRNCSFPFLLQKN